MRRCSGARSSWVHALWLHPFFTAEAWRRLYGFPWDVRLWAFFVHDLGYWKKKQYGWAGGRDARLCGSPYPEMTVWGAWGEFYVGKP